MQAGDHQAVLQEPEFHVLAAHDRAGIVGLAVQQNLLGHLRMNLSDAPVLDQQVEWLAAAQEMNSLWVQMPGNVKRLTYPHSHNFRNRFTLTSSWPPTSRDSSEVWEKR